MGSLVYWIKAQENHGGKVLPQEFRLEIWQKENQGGQLATGTDC